MEKMKYEVVAMSIAMFQRELEQQYSKLGVRWDSVIQPIVLEFASRMMSANHLFPEVEQDVPKTKAGPIQG